LSIPIEAPSGGCLAPGMEEVAGERSSRRSSALPSLWARVREPSDREGQRAQDLPVSGSAPQVGSDERHLGNHAEPARFAEDYSDTERGWRLRALFGLPGAADWPSPGEWQSPPKPRSRSSLSCTP